MRKAAFFDIDGTLFRNSLLIEHFKLLLKYNLLNESVWINNIKDKYKNWEQRKGDFEDYLDELVKMYIEGLKNVSLEYNDFVARRVIETKGDNIYLYTKKKLEEHIKNNDIVIFISGSPSFLVEKMAKKYNATDFIGTEYLIENGNFNGELIPMWDSVSKRNAIEMFTKKYNIDLENSYAYGDTTGDVSMFEMVGHPYAINPAARLLRTIKDNEEVKNKIKIVIERKNMAYSFLAKDLDKLELNFLEL